MEDCRTDIGDNLFCVLDSCRRPKGACDHRVTARELLDMITSVARPDVSRMTDAELASFKSNLPFLCSPMVETRCRGEHGDSSGFIQMDFDHIGYADAPRLRDYLAASPFCVLAALSSTDGVWALFRGDFRQFEMNRLCEVMKQVVNEAIPFEEYELSERAYSSVDSHVFNPEWGRYIAPDPDAKAGPAMDDETAVIAEVSEQEAMEALKGSAIFDLAKSFLHPALAGRAEFIYRSHGMASAIAAMAIACPSRFANFDLIPLCVCAVESQMGKSFCVDTLGAVAHNIGGVVVPPKTAEGLEDVLRCRLTMKDPDGARDEYIQSDLKPILVSMDEYGKQKSSGTASGYTGGLETALNEFCTGKIHVGASRNSLKNGTLKGGVLHTIGGVVAYGTPQSVADACAEDDQTDGRGRRTLTFAPEALTPNEQSRLVKTPTEVDAIANSRAIIERVLAIHGAYKAEVEMPCFDAFGFPQVHKFEATKRAIFTASMFMVGRPLDEKQWLYETAMAVACADGEFYIISEHHMVVAIAIVLGMERSTGRCASMIGQAVKGRHEAWIANCEKAMGALAKRFPEGVSYDSVRKSRCLLSCPHLDGRKASPFDLWKMQIIAPTRETVGLGKMKMLWEVFDEDNSLRIEGTQWEAESIVQSAPAPTPAPFSVPMVSSPVCHQSNVARHDNHPDKMRAERLAEDVATAPVGTRNRTLFNKACRAIEEANTPDVNGECGDVSAALRTLGEGALRSGLPAKEVEATLQSAIKKVGNNCLQEPWRFARTQMPVEKRR